MSAKDEVQHLFKRKKPKLLAGGQKAESATGSLQIQIPNLMDAFFNESIAARQSKYGREPRKPRADLKAIREAYDAYVRTHNGRTRGAKAYVKQKLKTTSKTIDKSLRES